MPELPEVETTRRTATLCTRPALSFGRTFFHSTGDSE